MTVWSAHQHIVADDAVANAHVGFKAHTLAQQTILDDTRRVNLCAPPSSPSHGFRRRRSQPGVEGRQGEVEDLQPMAGPAHQPGRRRHQQLLGVGPQGRRMPGVAGAIGAGVHKGGVVVVEEVLGEVVVVQVAGAQGWPRPQGHGEGTGVAVATFAEGAVDPVQGGASGEGGPGGGGGARGQQGPKGVGVEEDVGAKDQPSVIGQGVAVVDLHQGETAGVDGLLLPAAQGETAEEQVGDGLIQGKADRVEGRGVEPDGGARH